MSASVGDLVQASSPTEITPMRMLQVSVDRGDDLARIEKLMELERTWKADRAREAFYQALAEFKKVAVTVVKDKENTQYSKGAHKAMYTSLGNMVNTVNAAMAPFGLNANWEIDQTNGVTVTCVLSHTLGHNLKVSLSGPLDSSGSKNALQQIKSTITYLQAATYQAVTGVVSRDATVDDDGNGSGPETINEQQIADLESLIQDVGADKPRLLKWLKVETLAEIPAKNYATVVKQIEAKRAQKK